MKRRTMKDGSTIKELEVAVQLSIYTKCPEKYKLTDLETGQEYVGNTPNSGFGLSWRKIDA